MRRIIAAVVLMLLVVGIVALWRGGWTTMSVARKGGNEVTVVRVAPPATVTLPAPVSTLGAPSERARDVSEDRRASILVALRLPSGTRLKDVTTDDASKGIVCGTVGGADVEPGRRFVYVAMAGLAAIDDGGADFARAHARLCAP